MVTVPIPAAATAALLLLALARWPRRLITAARRLAAGLAVLSLWNLAMSGHGWEVGITPATAAVAGILGTPGVLLLLALGILRAP
ncbi:membrane protein of unknown function [Candidatus Hydrogenisulfobacillus filiaventi]|uniref:Pro-sigmaK processing inhibitor BofA n=1 Tax=Candidatus Hydrogenisulfobacillus filiaventi TaxID=2707344 RepID=A0A6F8ZK71_9FIRM|nr:membrane protein of unknown function [Candidatus Hydrogenisulfobacillus filiaventi]